MAFSEIDELHNQSRDGGREKKLELYNKIKEIYNSDESMKSNAELLWRFARACYFLANTIEKTDPMKKKLILEGRDYGAAAYKLEENNFNVLKWAAVLAGCAADLLGAKERIEQAFVYKMYVDKAIEMEPSDYSLVYMRGRFAYNVAKLSWVEKKTAEFLVAKFPKTTVDEALQDFLEAERLNPKPWGDNSLLIAKCYLAKDDEESAVKYLKSIVETKFGDDTDIETINEARDLLAKHSH